MPITSSKARFQFFRYLIFIFNARSIFLKSSSNIEDYIHDSNPKTDWGIPAEVADFLHTVTQLLGYRRSGSKEITNSSLYFKVN